MLELPDQAGSPANPYWDQTGRGSSWTSDYFCDAKSMWQSVKDVSPVTRLLVMPILGVIYLATIGRFFWLDLFYGIGVAIGLPTLAVAIYSYFV
jgi:MFS-type transporter involved in bile tolerance (Atg22 family)